MKRTSNSNKATQKSRPVAPSAGGILPVLPSVRIDTPCPKNWDEMDGDAARRYCGHCQKHVFNLEATPAQDASDLLQRVREGERLCMRIRKDAAGRIITRQDTDATMARRSWLQSVARTLAGAWGALLLSGCQQGEPRPVVGEIAPGEMELGGACPEVLHDAEACMGDMMVVPAQQSGNDGDPLEAEQEEAPAPLTGKPAHPP